MDSRRRAHAPTSPDKPAEPGPKLVTQNGASLEQRRRETAEYLSEMILELRNLARSVQLYTVMVPLEYAYYEAFSAANRVEIPPAELERLNRLARASRELDQLPAEQG